MNCDLQCKELIDHEIVQIKTDKRIKEFHD